MQQKMHVSKIDEAFAAQRTSSTGAQHLFYRYCSMDWPVFQYVIVRFFFSVNEEIVKLYFFILSVIKYGNSAGLRVFSIAIL